MRVRQLMWAAVVALISSAPAAAAGTLVQNTTLSKPLQVIYYGQQETGKYVFQASSGGSVSIGSVALLPAVAGLSISGSTCAAGLVLQGNLTCEVDVSFSPTGQGSFYSNLYINGTSFSIGVGVLPIPFAAAPVGIDFGRQLIGAKASRSVAFTNLNPFSVDFPLPLNSLVGADAADFQFTGGAGCDVAVTAYDVCFITYTFTPSKLGPESASVQIATGQAPGTPDSLTTTVTLTGTGTAGSATTTPVDLSPYYNVFAIGDYGVKPIAGGLDGLGYAFDAAQLPGQITWAGTTFTLGPPGVADAVTAATVAIPPGQYGQLYLLATGVRGDQPRHPFIATYSDGTSDTFDVSFSDWAFPANHANEALAVASSSRIDNTGLANGLGGPFRIYGYTLAVDRTKVLTGLKLPQSRNVITFALAASTSPVVPVAVDLSAYVNVVAIGENLPVHGPGIDGYGNTIPTSQLDLSPAIIELLWGQEPYVLPAPSLVPDAVSSALVALPHSTFSTLRLLGMGVNGSHTNETLVVTYADGSSTTVKQSFSDWHYPQGYANEQAAIVLPYRANSQGQRQPGTYRIYQYALPVDPTKVIASVQLPKDRNIVVLSMALLP